MSRRGGGTAARQAFTQQAGLQPERTSLAWQRTSLAFLTNGGLLVLRESAQPTHVVPRLVLAGIALVLAAGCTLLSWWRNRTKLERESRPRRLTPAEEVLLLGGGVVVLGAGCVFVLALPT